MRRFQRNNVISDSEEESFINETYDESQQSLNETSLNATESMISEDDESEYLQDTPKGLIATQRPSSPVYDTSEDEQTPTNRGSSKIVAVEPKFRQVEESFHDNSISEDEEESRVSNDSSDENETADLEESEYINESAIADNQKGPSEEVSKSHVLESDDDDESLITSFESASDPEEALFSTPPKKYPARLQVKNRALANLSMEAMETSPIINKSPALVKSHGQPSKLTKSAPMEVSPFVERRKDIVNVVEALNNTFSMETSPAVSKKSQKTVSFLGNRSESLDVSHSPVIRVDEKKRTVLLESDDSDEEIEATMISSFESAAEQSLTPVSHVNTPKSASVRKKRQPLFQPTSMDISPMKASPKAESNPKTEQTFNRPLARSTLLPSEIAQQTNYKMLPVPISALQSNQKPAVMGEVEAAPESVIFVDDSSSGQSSDSDVIIDGTGSKENLTTGGVLGDSDRSSGVGSNGEESHGAQSSGVSTKSNGSSSGHSSSSDSQSELQLLKKQIDEKQLALRNLSFASKQTLTSKLKDGGKLIFEKMKRCQLELQDLKQKYETLRNSSDEVEVIPVKKDTNNIIFSTRDQKIGDMGEKALEKHRIEKALTMDALVNLHSGLASAPGVDVLEEQPAGLVSELMRHQRQALAWLHHREKQSPAGGILADDMGLGKTLTMISLVLTAKEMNKDSGRSQESAWRSSGVKGPGHPGKTLVVCPASLLAQWEEQVKKHVRRGRLTTLLHHGTNREGRGRFLCNADIVVTTYGVLSQENKSKGALYRVAWERVILDEAHAIKNHKTQVAIAACELVSKYRWCLSGTPVHNKELDMYSLLKFIKCEPFDDLQVWKNWVDNKTAAGTERLNTVVKAILLRRTKEDLKAAGELKGALSTKEIHPIRVTLDDLEFAAYQSVLVFSKTLVGQYLQQRAQKAAGGFTQEGMIRMKSQMDGIADVKTHEILVLLLRLRQICSLPGLIHAMLEESDTDLDGFEKEEKVVEDLFKQVRRLTISAPPPEETAPEPLDTKSVLVTSNPVFNLERASSKINKVVEVVEKIVQKNEKVILVSQWSSFLKNIAQHLKKLNVKIATLDGSLQVKSRGPLVEEFNDPNSRLKVLLLSLTAGGVGLNLIGGNHLIIMEPHWNPQLESQACDRIYRVGQSKPVHIYKVICNETIEERIEALQAAKLKMADSVMSGQLKKESSKLTLQDIKSLFGLNTE